MEHAVKEPKTSSSDLDELLRTRDTRWYKGSLGRLNLIIALLLITSMTNVCFRSHIRHPFHNFLT
jgi:hypothetical protein